MLTQIQFEFKKVKGWLLIILSVVVIVSGTLIQIKGMQNDRTVLDVPTAMAATKTSVSWHIDATQQVLTNKIPLPEAFKKQTIAKNKRYLEELTTFQTALRAGNALKMNTLLSQSARKETPLASNFMLGHPRGGDTLLFARLVRDKIQAVPMLTEQTKSWNILGIFMRLPELASPDQPGWDGRHLTVERDFIFMIMTIFALILSLHWTQERPEKLDSFANVLPMMRSRFLLAKGIVSLGIFMVSLVLAALIFVFILGVNPHFGFGTINYPYLFTNRADKFRLVTIAEFSIQYLGFTFLWGFFLTSLTLFLTRLGKQPIVIFALLNFVIYSKQLGITPLLGTLNHYLPTDYLTFTNLLLTRGDYQSIPIAQGVFVLVVWSGLLILVSGLLIRKRGRI